MIFYLVLLCTVLYGVWKSWILGRLLTARPSVRPLPRLNLPKCLMMSAVELSKRFEAGDLKPSYVTDSYIDHIRKINPFLNAVVYELFDEARIRAEAADAAWERWRKGGPKPHWMCGVPCTIKECIQVKGCPNTSGHHRRTGRISSEDSACVSRLRAAGCVFLGLTNTSELCMWMESNNNVYGITCNPYDPRRLVGGSSGGEGASVAACFAPFGLGSDVGGSIRMPAFFNGLFGFKASSHTIPNRGQHPGARGKINHLLGTGPLCRFAEDLLPITHVLAEGGFLEPERTFPRPPQSQFFNHPVVTTRNEMLCARSLIPKKLRVFAILDFNLFAVSVSPSQKATILLVAEHLRDKYDAEVTIVDLKFPKDPTLNRHFMGKGDTLGDADSFAHICTSWPRLFPRILKMWAAHMGCDEAELTFTQFMSEGLPDGGQLRPFHEYFKWLSGKSKHTSMSIGLCMIESIQHYFETDSMKQGSFDDGNEFRESINDALHENGVLLTPTYPIPAPKHHEPTWFPFQWQYTAAFNLARTPTINLPVWTGAGSGKKAPSYEQARAKKSQDFHLPKGVQLSASWGNDKLVLALAQSLETDGIVGFRYPSWVENC